ncbi:MAG: hypothetical protein HY730_09340 [Candidatus Tectomicrobia bacterium]|uniref:Uncharacterized protein n=1 Tax=Tectimicrobiota bacterium TaxID=2528274 RepID=A0A933GPN6_UNCTE|nr:hypothetical protein [Candidatus Tectomicrobia bacterium]
MTRAEVGLPFTSKLETLRHEINTQEGSSLGRPRRWSKAIIRFFETIGGLINGEQVETRLPENFQDNPVPLYSSDYSVLNLGWDSEGTIKIEQPEPFPMTILGINGILDLAED